MITDNTQIDVDFAGLTATKQPHLDGGTIQLRQGQYSGAYYEGEYADPDGNEYRAIWTEIDATADAEEDACDWANPDYLIAE
jgi:predicted lactoylglutathione lyase